MGGWYDLYASHVFTSWEGYRPRGGGDAARRAGSSSGRGRTPSSLSPGPATWTSAAGSMLDLETLEPRWFDHWLKGVDNGVDPRGARSRLFLMGANELARRARVAAGPAPSWQRWYLHSGGPRQHPHRRRDALAPPPEPTNPPTGTSTTRDYPVPTRGGQQLLLARHRPLGAVRPARRGDARGRARATPARPWSTTWR